MGDLPQYFKFVRWMLTSSLKLFSVHHYPVWVVETFLNALFNTSAFICRLIDIVKSTHAIGRNLLRKAEAVKS